ncbi:hypothetical protein C6499_22500 [Candidatus Poribacteria bacterium]|nr:MAG: hypothetical protein C6499_22500 [Candidatus Poribacteria bacterium]
MNRLQRSFYCLLILILSVLACDEAEIHQIIDDITSDATDSLGDPFEGAALQNLNWRWQNEPPTWTHHEIENIAKWDIGETRANHLFIEAEPNRNLWTTDQTHILYQEIDTDVLDVETKFTARWNTTSGVTGLIVKSPADDNWVTLKFWARDATARGFVQFHNKPDYSANILSGRQFQIENHGETDLFYRLTKAGDTYTAWYRAQETQDWTHVGDIEFKLTPPLWVGIYAGNATSSKRMQVEFEYFRDNLNPITN